MLEVMAVQDRVKGVPCSHCQKPSVGRCVDCEVFLCQECLTDHNKYRGFVNHSVLSMDELAKPENQRKIRRKLHCQEHEKTLKFYCETCEKLICRDCTDFNHEKPEHSWLPVDKVAEKQKQLLAESCTALENKLKRGNQALRKVNDVTQSLANVKERVKLEINARRDTILETVTRQLNEKAQDLIKQVDGIYSRKHDSLAKQKVEFQAYVEKVESCVNISKEMLTKGTDEEILSSAKMMKENIAKLRKEIPKTMEPDGDDEICYEYGPIINIMTVGKVCAEMGKVEDRNQTILNKMMRISYADSSNDKDNICSSASKVEIHDTGLTVEPLALSGTSITNKESTSSVQKVEDRRAQKQNAAKGHRQNQIKSRRHVSSQKGKPRATTEHCMFEDTKVKLNQDFLQNVVNVGQNETNKILETEEVKLSEGYLSGSWNAVSKVFKRFCQFFNGGGDPRAGQPTTESSASLESTTESDDKTFSGKPEEESIQVDALLLRYIMTYHYEMFQELENVSAEVKFEIISANEKKLKLIARAGVSEELFRSSIYKFITFYQKQYENMFKEVIPEFASSISELGVSDVRAKFSVLVIPQKTNQILVYGEKTEVEQASSFIKQKISAFSGNVTKTQNIYGLVRKKQLSYNLSEKIKLLVYQGDITEEKVDAIVNPANEDLSHVGDAAFAIAKQGGGSIQTQSDDIMKRRGKSLKPGEVERTAAGDLPCNFIVHAGGPRWAYCSRSEARKLLQNAVLNSLRIASQNKAQSIAIPAISSGVFGVPVKLCAEVLFTTVEEFSKAATDSESLKEIRFVNIDKPTVDAFEQEMRKRYGASVKNESRENGVSKGNRMNTSMGNNQNQIPTSNANSKQNIGPENSKTKTRKDGQTSQPAKESYNGSQKIGGIPNTRTSPQEGDQTNHPLSYYKAVTNNLGKPKDGTSNADTTKCPICLDEMKNPRTLNKCNHTFCTTCIDNAFKHQKKCPICSEVYGQLTGNQPPGQMSTRRLPGSLPGYENCGTIIIEYYFNDGKQGPNHPNPGRPYTGTSRRGYLPDNDEGRKVQHLLRKAFIQKLTFTIGRSSTTGVENTVIWNDIHHKTNTDGGSINYGYPDPTYLRRVKEDLAAKGIKE